MLPVVQNIPATYLSNLVCSNVIPTELSKIWLRNCTTTVFYLHGQGMVCHCFFHRQKNFITIFILPKELTNEAIVRTQNIDQINSSFLMFFKNNSYRIVKNMRLNRAKVLLHGGNTRY